MYITSLFMFKLAVDAIKFILWVTLSYAKESYNTVLKKKDWFSFLQLIKLPNLQLWIF